MNICDILETKIAQQEFLKQSMCATGSAFENIYMNAKIFPACNGLHNTIYNLCLIYDTKYIQVKYKDLKLNIPL